MRKTHARPSKKFVCGKCKKRIRWMPQVHRAGGRGQLIWCEECWNESVVARPAYRGVPALEDAPAWRVPAPERGHQNRGRHSVQYGHSPGMSGP